MTFNETLCNKARFGDIAIFNDGDREKLKELLCHIWPKDSASSNPCGEYKYYFKSGRINDGNWYFGDQTDLPAHSVKDFIMNTTDSETLDNTVSQSQPRTYRVTRSQMKEIHSKAPEDYTVRIRLFTKDYFDPFETEALLSEKSLKDLIKLFEGVDQSVLKSIFPAYFFIPEGEPVLVRDLDHEDWLIGMSDGKGDYRVEVSGKTYKAKQIIPFTKNPPK